MSTIATEVAETIKAELQLVDGKPVQPPSSITISASFASVRAIVENSRPLRRPNRNKPIDPLFAELDALTTGPCEAWNDDRSQIED